MSQPNPTNQPENASTAFADAMVESERRDGHWAPLLNAHRVIDLCYASRTTIRLVQSPDVTRKQFQAMRELLGTTYRDPRVIAWIKEVSGQYPPLE